MIDRADARGCLDSQALIAYKAHPSSLFVSFLFDYMQEAANPRSRCAPGLAISQLSLLRTKREV